MRSARLAETLVATLLRLKGNRIVARRYKTPVGEIDLVALRGKRLASSRCSGARRARTRIGRCPPGSDGGSCAPRNIGLPATPSMPATTSSFDVVLTAPFSWSRYIANAFPV